MESFERRKYARISNQFKVKIRLSRLSEAVEGVTQNLSQGGAFVSIPSWPAFEKNDQAELRIFLPPEFTGQTDEYRFDIQLFKNINVFGEGSLRGKDTNFHVLSTLKLLQSQLILNPRLPSPRGQQLIGRDLLDIQPAHGVAEILGHLSDNGRVLVMRGRPDNCLGSDLGIARLEDTRADKDPLGAELHH